MIALIINLLFSLPPSLHLLLVCSQVILTNQITTHLSGALASQADLVSPADDLSLSEGKGSVLEGLKLDTDIQPRHGLPASC